MSLTLAIATFFIIWWTTLFAVLPFGTRSQEEEGHVVPGTPEGAPSRFRVGRVMLINTLVSAIVFAGVWTALTYDLLPHTVVDFAKQRSPLGR